MSGSDFTQGFVPAIEYTKLHDLPGDVQELLRINGLSPEWARIITQDKARAHEVAALVILSTRASQYRALTVAWQASSKAGIDVTLLDFLRIIAR